MAPNQTQETPFSLTCHWLEFLSLEGSATVKWSRQYVQFCTQENQRLETRHMEAEKPAFRTRLPPNLTFLTHYQTGWNVTSATPAKQNDMTTSLETFEKERFCGFPHRHGEATGKPETRDETRGSTKTSISCETSSNFDTLQLQNRRFPTCFP